MVDQELLLAISDMMDKKLKSELQPLKEDLQGVKEEVRSVKEDLQGVKEDLQGVKEDQQGIKEDLRGVKDRLQSVEEEVHQIKLYQENILESRLSTIESCYLDTYKRYRDYVDVIDPALDDIKILKKVVAEHSEKLQKFA